jgi:GNAT superfamily N-acetyltransferase
MIWIKSLMAGPMQSVAGQPREIANMAKTTKSSPRRSTAGLKAAAAPIARVRQKRLATERGAPAKSTRATDRARVASRAASTSKSPEKLQWTETLADGTHVLVRPLRKADAGLERAFIKRLSPESRRMRFLGQMSEPSDELIRSLTELNPKRDMAFAALVHRDGEKLEIGVSRYQTSPDGRICECAVTVSDEWQQKGLGTLLMRHLIDVARSRGIRKMISLDSADNLQMRDLAHFLGFSRQVDPQDPTEVIHILTLD